MAMKKTPSNKSLRQMVDEVFEFIGKKRTINMQSYHLYQVMYQRWVSMGYSVGSINSARRKHGEIYKGLKILKKNYDKQKRAEEVFLKQRKSKKTMIEGAPEDAEALLHWREGSEDGDVENDALENLQAEERERDERVPYSDFYNSEDY